MRKNENDESFVSRVRDEYGNDTAINAKTACEKWLEDYTSQLSVDTILAVDFNIKIPNKIV